MIRITQFYIQLLKDRSRVCGEKYDRLSNQHYIKEPIEPEGTVELAIRSSTEGSNEVAH